MFGKGNQNLLGVATVQVPGNVPVAQSSCPYRHSLGSVTPHTLRGTFDIDLEAFYQSDADFEKSVELWNRFPEKEVVMQSTT